MRDSDLVSSALEEAIACFRRTEYQRVVQIAQRLLQLVPEHGRLWELRGLAQHALNDATSATHALEMASLFVPLSALAQCTLARCYLLEGRQELAVDMLRHLLTRADLPDALLPLVAANLGRAGEPTLALEACRRAATAGVDDGQPYYGMAHYMELLGYPLELICSTLREAIRSEPDCFQYRYAYANSCWRLGRFTEACQTLEKVVDDATLRGIKSATCVETMCQIFSAEGNAQLTHACYVRLAEITTND